jgi:hypothetical protein
MFLAQNAINNDDLMTLKPYNLCSEACDTSVNQIY